MTETNPCPVGLQSKQWRISNYLDECQSIQYTNEVTRGGTNQSNDKYRITQMSVDQSETNQRITIVEVTNGGIQTHCLSPSGGQNYRLDYPQAEDKHIDCPQAEGKTVALIILSREQNQRFDYPQVEGKRIDYL